MCLASHDHSIDHMITQRSSDTLEIPRTVHQTAIDFVVNSIPYKAPLLYESSHTKLGQWLILRVVVLEHILSIIIFIYHRNIWHMESTFHKKCHILAYSEGCCVRTHFIDNYIYFTTVIFGIWRVLFIKNVIYWLILCDFAVKLWPWMKSVFLPISSVKSPDITF